jgi:hypothetical protein
MALRETLPGRFVFGQSMTVASSYVDRTTNGRHEEGVGLYRQWIAQTSYELFPLSTADSRLSYLAQICKSSQFNVASAGRFPRPPPSLAPAPA